jgi:hypothetical protein
VCIGFRGARGSRRTLEPCTTTSGCELPGLSGGELFELNGCELLKLSGCELLELSGCELLARLSSPLPLPLLGLLLIASGSLVFCPVVL